MNDLNNTWKYANKTVFEKQLSLNKMELDNYPSHWKQFVILIKALEFDTRTLLDIGCGCGVFSELCKRELPHIDYFGIDYSEQAVKIAKREWGEDKFQIADFTTVNPSFFKNFDLVHLGAVLDVTTNGDQLLEYILSLSNDVIVGRMQFINKESHYNRYVAYDEVETVQYFHNTDNYQSLLEKHKYKCYPMPDCHYLRKIV
jgi:trans-aconitate methyltransferase